jgi:hypothetical protein
MHAGIEQDQFPGHGPGAVNKPYNRFGVQQLEGQRHMVGIDVLCVRKVVFMRHAVGRNAANRWRNHAFEYAADANQRHRWQLDREQFGVHWMSLRAMRNGCALCGLRSGNTVPADCKEVSAKRPLYEGRQPLRAAHIRNAPALPGDGYNSSDLATDS